LIREFSQNLGMIPNFQTELQSVNSDSFS